MLACYARGNIKQLAYLQVTLQEAKRDSDRHSTRLVRSTAPERKGVGEEKKKRKKDNESFNEAALTTLQLRFWAPSPFRCDSAESLTSTMSPKRVPAAVILLK